MSVLRRFAFFFTTQEALIGEVAPGNEEFQTAIKLAVPVGWVFKVCLLERKVDPTVIGSCSSMV